MLDKPTSWMVLLFGMSIIVCSWIIYSSFNDHNVADLRLTVWFFVPMLGISVVSMWYALTKPTIRRVKKQAQTDKTP